MLTFLSYAVQKHIVIPNIIALIIIFRCQNHQHRPRRKVIHLPPDPRTNQQSSVGLIQPDIRLVPPVIHTDRTGPCHTEQNLIQFPVRMFSTNDTFLCIIHKIYSLNGKRDILILFQRHQLPAPVSMLLKINKLRLHEIPSTAVIMISFHGLYLRFTTDAFGACPLSQKLLSL